MKVKELIKYLQTLPSEADVTTLESHYYGDATQTPLTVDGLDYTDYTTNTRIKEGHPAFGLKELVIGVE